MIKDKAQAEQIGKWICETMSETFEQEGKFKEKQRKSGNNCGIPVKFFPKCHKDQMEIRRKELEPREKELNIQKIIWKGKST